MERVKDIPTIWFFKMPHSLWYFEFALSMHGTIRPVNSLVDRNLCHHKTWCWNHAYQNKPKPKPQLAKAKSSLEKHFFVVTWTGLHSMNDADWELSMLKSVSPPSLQLSEDEKIWCVLLEPAHSEFSLLCALCMTYRHRRTFDMQTGADNVGPITEGPKTARIQAVVLEAVTGL